MVELMHIKDIAFEFVSWVSTEFIKSEIKAEDRILKLNKIAIEQLQLLLNYSAKKIEKQK